MTDHAVTFDARHHLWLTEQLAFDHPQFGGAPSIVVTRSPDGLHWSTPITVAARPGEFYDKPWITCDNSEHSRFYGACYVAADRTAMNNQAVDDDMIMITSTDGGAHWSDERTPVDHAAGAAGVPVVQPNGTVVVPYLASDFSSVKAFTSTNGGASWNASVVVSNSPEKSATGVHEAPVPGATVDGAGRVYVTWDDCRFRANCSANDLVLSTSTDGVKWSPASRVPTAPITSSQSSFTPGITVDPGTSGNRARIGLYYYFQPDSGCAIAACQLAVGYVSSVDGGATWSTPRMLAGPFPLSWLAQADGAAMVGFYLGATTVRGSSVSVFAVAHPPSGSTLNQPMATAGPLAVAIGCASGKGGSPTFARQ